MDHLSELGELCWNLGSLNQIKAEQFHACRREHTRFMVMGRQTVAHSIHCAGDLEVLGIRKALARRCKRRHLPRS